MTDTGKGDIKDGEVNGNEVNGNEVNGKGSDVNGMGLAGRLEFRMVVGADAGLDMTDAWLGNASKRASDCQRDMDIFYTQTP